MVLIERNNQTSDMLCWLVYTTVCMTGWMDGQIMIDDDVKDEWRYSSVYNNEFITSSMCMLYVSIHIFL